MASVKEKNFDFMKIIQDKEIDVMIPNLGPIDIKKSSLFTILHKINPGEFESLCSHFITCRIVKEEKSITSSVEYELDPKYVNLLNHTKSFFITQSKNSNTIMITDFSLKKIVKFLKKDIVEISDFISVAIFVLTNEELHQRQTSLNRLSLRANILERYGHLRNTINFSGITEFDDNSPEIRRNEQLDIIIYDMMFENINRFLDGTQMIPIHEMENQVHEKFVQEVESLEVRDSERNNRNYANVMNGNKLLLSRQRLSRQKACESSDDFDSVHLDIPGEEVNFEDSPKKLKASNKPRAAKKGKKRYSDYQNDYGDYKNVYLLFDLDENPVIISEDNFELLSQAKDSERISREKGVSVFDDYGKIVSVDFDTIDAAKFNDDRKMIKLLDVNGDEVVVNKRKLDKLAEEPKEFYQIEDYTGRKVFVHYVKSGTDIKLKFGNKTLYCIRIAKIEVSDVSNLFH